MVQQKNVIEGGDLFLVLFMYIQFWAGDSLSNEAPLYTTQNQHSNSENHRDSVKIHCFPHKIAPLNEISGAIL